MGTMSQSSSTLPSCRLSDRWQFSSRLAATTNRDEDEDASSHSCETEAAAWWPRWELQPGPEPIRGESLLKNTVRDLQPSRATLKYFSRECGRVDHVRCEGHTSLVSLIITTQSRCNPSGPLNSLPPGQSSAAAFCVVVVVVVVVVFVCRSRSVHHFEPSMNHCQIKAPSWCIDCEQMAPWRRLVGSARPRTPLFALFCFHK